MRELVRKFISHPLLDHVPPSVVTCQSVMRHDGERVRVLLSLGSTVMDVEYHVNQLIEIDRRQLKR